MSEKYDANWAGTEKYHLPQDWALSGSSRAAVREKIAYPEGETVEWYGFVRHNFEIEGHAAFIVEPPNPAPGLPWSWCVQWAEAFVPRTPALKLLERGFHHVHIDVFDSYMNSDGIRVVEKFYALLQSLGFASQAALIGMSYGGLFSFRWAAEHPETVAAIYADAPVCDLAKYPKHVINEVYAAYGCKTREEIDATGLNPIDNLDRLVKCNIPIIHVIGLADEVVYPAEHSDVLEKRYRELGGFIKVLKRPYIGHHPHGYDDPRQVVDFICENYAL